ncbi:MAG TPA: SDR family NAD(P)-dependent oxidoreductase [Microbacteriaceae bacterium]|nr:SDR family NAD(P)-dependent oxidoreductase [Microbacteriaceae bacterium]
MEGRDDAAGAERTTMSDTSSQHTIVMVGQTPVETWGARRFEGRIAAVTGAARGIGRAVAERLIAEGATVYCLDLRAELLEETWNGVDRAVTIATDVGDSAAVDAAFERIRAEHGKLHVLVCNAGIPDHPKRAKDFPGDPEPATIDDETWEFVLRVNLTGTFNCIRAGVPLIRAVGLEGGAIVNLSSVAALHPSPLAVPYPSSKAGIIGMTHAFAALLGKENIRVNAIAPAATDGAMMPEDKEYLATLTAKQPIDRLVPPSEMAANIVYLCSDEAQFITGQTVSVSGGMVM